MSIEQKLYPIKIEEIRNIGKGEEYCLTFSKFKKGHYMLSSPYSRCLFVTPMASKVNIAAASTYVLCKDGKEDRTKYLNELKKGDEILTLDIKGNELSSIIKEVSVKERYMLLITGSYKVDGRQVFDLIKKHGENYFNDYRRIFHLKGKTGKRISVLGIEKYKDKKNDIYAYLDVGTVVPEDFEVKIGDKIPAYIQMPGFTRHFGMGCNDRYCLEPIF